MKKSFIISKDWMCSVIYLFLFEMLVKEMPHKYILRLNTVSIVLMSGWHTVSPVQFQLDPSDIITSGPTTVKVSKSKWCPGMGVAEAIHHKISACGKTTLHIIMKLQKCWNKEKLEVKGIIDERTFALYKNTFSINFKQLIQYPEFKKNI